MGILVIFCLIMPTATIATEKPLRIAINGFGRIGRNVLRCYLERGVHNNLDIIAINDIADNQTLLHLLKYDSSHGRLTTPVELDKNSFKLQVIQANSHTHQDISEKTQTIHLFSEANPNKLPWAKLDVDMVLECTGQFRSYHDAKQHIYAGAKQVIIGAAPFDDVDACIVYGVNHAELTKSHQVISSVSCTTQALVPLVKLLEDAYGIESAMMTEIHAVTADQTVLDQAHRDLRRARASGYNIIPTTSSSLGALKRVLPHMEHKIEGYSIRVPTLDVAAIDVTAMLKQTVTVAKVNAMLKQAALTQYNGIMQLVEEPLVSTDFIHQPYSLIVDSLQTMQVGKQLKVFAWYDNEWGYANRLVDMCLYLAQSD